METSAQDRAERRLAILAADMAGYSRLIGHDEEGTLNRIRSIRTEVIDPAIGAHRGRLVKTTGDGLPVQFSSVAAVRSIFSTRGPPEHGHTAGRVHSDSHGRGRVPLPRRF